jgi:hypothetical protein
MYHDIGSVTRCDTLLRSQANGIINLMGELGGVIITLARPKR